MNMKKIIHNQCIPFKIESSSDPFYCLSNLEALRESINEYCNGDVIEKTFSDLEKYI